MPPLYQRSTGSQENERKIYFNPFSIDISQELDIIFRKVGLSRKGKSLIISNTVRKSRVSDFVLVVEPQFKQPVFTFMPGVFEQ